ncbi:MAG: hypothetical protein JSR00_00705 [Bacteroidetes bacterium]|nr:hypothetical protein [Bacteroidota bacterium]
MKKLYLVSIFAVLLSFFATAQKSVSEATIVYDISVLKSDNPKISSALEGATLSLYLKGNESKSEMKSKLGREADVYNSATGNGFILKDYSGQKLMITLNKSNWIQKNSFYSGLKFNIEDYPKTIAGYKVKRASAVLPSGKEFIVYFSPEINLSNKSYNNAFPQLNGLPIQYELESGNVLFRYMLKSFTTDNVTDSEFDKPKADYRVMTYDESQRLKIGNPK